MATSKKTKTTETEVVETAATETPAATTNEQLSEKLDAILDGLNLGGVIDKDKIVEDIKDKLTDVGTEFKGQLDTIVKDLVAELVKNTGEAVTEKVENVLEAKKDEWAALAVQDPDDARRKLRTFWVGVSGICAVVGVVVGYLLNMWI